MKKAIVYTLYTLMCMHITILPTHAENANLDSNGTSLSGGTITTDTSLSDAFESILTSLQNAIGSDGEITNTPSDSTLYTSTRRQEDNLSIVSGELALDAAPIESVVNTIPQNYTYTPWELIQRAPMLAGFMWTGSIANFITPQMYVGTPLSYNGTIGTVVYGQSSSTGKSSYNRCKLCEIDASFGTNGSLYKNNTYDELRDIAKYCAVNTYGKYFTGKPYTTREEFLMMLFTMFDEDIEVPGRFTADGIYIADDHSEIETGYDNISPTAWYAGYLSVANEYGLIPSEGTWSIAQEVSDTEISDTIALYSEYIMNTTTDSLKHAVINTNIGRYMIDWNSDESMSIQKR